MTVSRSYSVCITVQSVQSPGPFSVIWLSRSKQTKPRGHCPFCLSFQWQGRPSPSQRRQRLRRFWLRIFLQDVFEERDNDWCIAVSYLLITTDGIAIIHCRCHLSGVQRQRRSVAKRGAGAGSAPSKSATASVLVSVCVCACAHVVAILNRIWWNFAQLFGVGKLQSSSLGVKIR